MEAIALPLMLTQSVKSMVNFARRLDGIYISHHILGPDYTVVNADCWYF